jgi:hypothetical protein
MRDERLAAALEKVPLGRVVGAGNRRLVRQRRIGVAAQPPQQVGADGMEQVIAVEAEAASGADGFRAEVVADESSPELAV